MSGKDRFAIFPSRGYYSSYIISDLDELEREEFYRLKIIQDKKIISRKKADERKAALLAAGVDVRHQVNILDVGDDDVVF